MTRRLRFLVPTFALAVGALLPATSSAQSAGSVTFGLKGGFNKSRIQFDPRTTTVNSVWGGAGGLFAGNQITDNVGVQVEGLFVRRATDFALVDIPVQASIELNYVDLVFIVKGGATLRDKIKLFLFTGPQVALQIAADLTIGEGGERRDFSDEIKKTDFGWAFGVGGEVGSFSLDARYTFGLKNILKRPDVEVQGLKNRTLAVLLGVRLR